MQIITRAALLATLTGPVFDPDSEFNEELTAFARAIQAHAPEQVTHFVYSDSENGEDPTIEASGLFYDLSGDLIPMTYNKSGDSYYGVSFTQHTQYGDQPDNRVVYNCYLGGSPLNSAPGFVLAGATLLG